VRAAYLPPSATDWQVFNARADAAAAELRRGPGLDLTVLPALHSSKLPLLEKIELSTVSRLRLDAGALEGWRRALRQAGRGLATVPVEGEAFASDSRQVLEDMLLPAEQEMARDAALLGRLRRGGRDASVSLVTGAAAAGVTAAVVGGPPIGLLTAGVSAAAGWTLKALLPAQRTGVAQVVAYLAAGAR